MIQDLNEISDGKVYNCNGMVRVACNDCEGCHACCEHMGTSIVLDPMDIWRLSAALDKGFEELMTDTIEFHVVEGIILPNLKMTGEKMQCIFLNEEGRCSIHKSRPGLCRAFPLGRIYEEADVSYFVQRDACQKTNCSKMKVSKWLDTPNLKEYQRFLLDWHKTRKQIQKWLAAQSDEAAGKTINLFLMKLFFVTPYDTTQEFYPQFYERLQTIKDMGLC